jgi:hypothetical protein
MKFFTTLLLLAASPLAILAAPLPGDAGLVAKDLGLYVNLFPNVQQSLLSHPWVMFLLAADPSALGAASCTSVCPR